MQGTAYAERWPEGGQQERNITDSTAGGSRKDPQPCRAGSEGRLHEPGPIGASFWLQSEHVWFCMLGLCVMFWKGGGGGIFKAV